MSTEGDLIEIVGLSSAYGDFHALDNVRFGIPKNQITVIMGVSGCGKTTLLRHLVGLKRTPPGQILVEGEDLGKFNESKLHAYRRKIGVLFQSGALFNSLSVQENIAVPLKVHTELAGETIRIMALMKLKLVGLSGFCDYMPSQLSGGMRKRAGLARALAMDPEILFVDEPSSGLDPITAADLDRMILELRETLGMTIVVVTHELESAFKIASRVVVMDKGKVMAMGSPEEVLKSSDERVRQFLGRKADKHQVNLESYYACLMATD